MNELEHILKGVSRSFYLSLKFLPVSLRSPVKLAFLCCKAADTIADTRIIPSQQRLTLLRQYREHFRGIEGDFFKDNSLLSGESLGGEKDGDGISSSEQNLLHNLPLLFGEVQALAPVDRQLIHELVTELTQGMIADLTFFPDEQAGGVKALNTEAELDQYTYYVAGCVGRFWTRSLTAHCSFAKHWDQSSLESSGESFGKGLQLVNILRDLPRDLQYGRCYLPAEKLQALGLEAKDLLQKTALARVRPYLQELIAKTRNLLDAGAIYADAHPRYAIRLKWCVLLPMQLGQQTIDLLENSLQQSHDWLDPSIVYKVPRRTVYRSMGSSLWQSLFPGVRKAVIHPAMS